MVELPQIPHKVILQRIPGSMKTADIKFDYFVVFYTTISSKLCYNNKSNSDCYLDALKFVMECRFCYPGSLNETLVKGKIVFCDYESNGYGATEAGAVGAVFRYEGNIDHVVAYTLPLSNLNLDDGRIVLNYVNITEYLLTSLPKYLFIKLN